MRTEHQRTHGREREEYDCQPDFQHNRSGRRSLRHRDQSMNMPEINPPAPAATLDWSAPPEVAPPVEKPAAKPSLRAQAVRGSLWQGVSLGVGQLLRLGSNIILARLLFPEVFGLSTLALSISKGLNMFTDVGIGPNIIQSERGDDPVFLNTAWTVQIVRALGLALILSIIAFPAARGYGESRLFPILLAMAAGHLINGFASTSLFSMNRHMEIGRMSMLNIGEQVASLVVTIAIAWVYPSVWAVVIGWFGGGIFRLISSHIYNRQSPNRFCWDQDALQ